MSPTILCSTGIVTQEPDQTDHKLILEHAPKLGASGYELQVHKAWYGHLDEVVEGLRGSDLSFPALHADKGIGTGLGSGEGDEADEALASLEVNCRAAAALGARTLVLHLWEDPAADEEIERNLDRLPACLDTAGAYDVTLTVETLQGVAGTPLANIRLAIERDSRCKVTLDSEFLGFHGQLAESVAADWLWEDRRVRHVHLKDFDGRMRAGGVRRYLLPGEGTLDLQGFINGLLERGYDGAITLESNAIGQSGQLDEARLEQIAAVVRQLSGT
jgi:sugar phosphate isomerase/epimerase